MSVRDKYQRKEGTFLRIQSLRHNFGGKKIEGRFIISIPGSELDHDGGTVVSKPRSGILCMTRNLTLRTFLSLGYAQLWSAMVLCIVPDVTRKQ